MYSDFYEIPLPALRFEKVEETDTKEVNDTEETTLDHVRSTSKEKNVTKGRHTTLIKAKKRRINHKQTTRKEHTRFQNNETQTETERQ